jgi:hypothetical protein
MVLASPCVSLREVVLLQYFMTIDSAVYRIRFFVAEHAMAMKHSGLQE